MAVASLGVTGCGPADKGASPDEAQQRIQATVPSMAESLSRSMERWGENQNLSSLSQSLDTVSASFERMFPGLITEEEDTIEPLARLLPAEGDETGEEADVSAAIEALAEKIFTEENHEGNGVYLVRGALFCEVDGAVDPDCAAEIDALELRIHAVEAGDGLDLGFRIGPDQAEPFGLELRSNRLSVVLDLADLKESIEFLSEDDEAAAALPQVMEGVLAFSVLAPSENEVEVQVAVREALRFETDSSGSGSAMKISTEASDPLFSVRMGETSLVMTVDVGRTRVTGPWGELQGDGLELGDLDIDWQGLTYQVNLSGDSDVLAVRNIGLGDGTSTIKLDSETLVAVDLNKDSGRSFDLELSLDEAGLPVLAIAPGIDLQVSYNLEPLSEGGVAVDAPLLRSSYALSLRGDAPVVQPVEADALSGFPGGLRVISGELAVSADDAAESVVVPAGKCLVEGEPAADAHPLIGALSAVDCPL